MAIFLTGPIENRSVSGNRPTQEVIIKLVNTDLVNLSRVLLQGYYLNGNRTLYVLEQVVLAPNEVLTKNILQTLMHLSLFLLQVVLGRKILRYLFGEEAYLENY